MKTAVLYTSKHGTTYSIAKHIAMALNADVYSLKEFDLSSLPSYETIVLGSPIYAGKSFGDMELFCRDNLQSLLGKRLALFVCGLTSSHHAQQRQLESAYLKPLHKHAVIGVFVGGAINVSKLSTLEKLITRTQLRVSADVTDINQTSIEQLIAAASS